MKKIDKALVFGAVFFTVLAVAFVLVNLSMSGAPEVPSENTNQNQVVENNEIEPEEELTSEGLVAINPTLGVSLNILEEGVLSVDLDGAGSNVRSIGIELTFDPSLIEITGQQNGDIFEFFIPDEDVADGRVTLAFASSGDTVPDITEGSFATVSYTKLTEEPAEVRVLTYTDEQAPYTQVIEDTGSITTVEEVIIEL